jgi:hypothetical protein
MAEPARAQPIKAVRANFAEQFRRGDSYGLLLALILLTYVVMALVDHDALWARFAISAMLGAVLLLALHTSHVRERSFEVCAVVVGVAALSTFLQAVFDRNGNDGTTFVMFVLVIAAPVVILNRILRHRVIGRETILGAVCVYVLLGMVFAGLFAAINDVDGGKFFTQRPVESNIDFLYFSFVVLTTLGFGDLTPAPDIARVMVTFEALIGQVFLVTLVARLMSLYGMERRQDVDVAIDVANDGVPDARLHVEIDDDGSELEE